MLDYWQRKLNLLQGDTVAAAGADTEPAGGAMLQLSSIIEESIVDGPGMRFVVFTQGCPHRCPGCHNPQTHLSVGGTWFSTDRVLDLYDAHPLLRGATLSGGEPFEQAAALAILADAIHDRGGDVLVYTGYRLERLEFLARTDDGIRDLLARTDLLIDGRFLLAQRSLDVPFVGSLNQRLIARSELGNRLLDDIANLENASRLIQIRHID